MKSPTSSILVIRRQLVRARRDGVMVVLHPDTVEWLAQRAAARENCVLRPARVKAVARLLRMLQDELEVTIRSNRIPGRNNQDQPKEVMMARKHWQEAEELVKRLKNRPVGSRIDK